MALALALAGCGPEPRDASYYAALTASLRAEGKLRTDRAPADAPYTNADLVRNFREIVFYSEFIKDDGQFIKKRTAFPLSKRTQPVRLKVFGSSLTDSDTTYIVDYTKKLQTATSISIKIDDARPNILLGILTDDEMNSLADIFEGFGNTAISDNLRRHLPGSVCVEYPAPNRSDDNDWMSVIVIPAAVDGLLRQACIEEELGQSFGPSADYDAARPSIFNDDQEFALLTEHDEYLLRILYDPALKPGMTEAEAMALVPGIVARLRPGGVGG